MSAKLGILVVHGMGSQTQEGFTKSTDAMIARIAEELRRNQLDPAAIAWQRGYWGDILQRHEDELLKKKMSASALGWMWLRHFVIDNIGDAVAYQREPNSPDDFYCQIHDRIHGELLQLRAQLGNADAPLIILAHSLGGYIMSTYIWDRQHHSKDDKYGQTALERMETLASIITFGCNIAIFSLALDPYLGISFP